MIRHWTDSIVYSVVYSIVIFLAQRVMKHRAPFNLRSLMVVWSSLLAVFSIVGTVKTTQVLFISLKTHGLLSSVCFADFKHRLACWGFLFALSKLVEFGDTLFIVLRKQKLIFLHWYHHVTVLIYCWISFAEHAGISLWFCAMNYFVHSIMYTYYALRAMKFMVPKSVNILITVLQLLQMLFGVAINIWTVIIKQRGEECNQTFQNSCLSFVMYFTYLLLFVHYFFKTYLVKTPRKPSVKHFSSLNGFLSKKEE